LTQPRWDIFCSVVDNYGDVGVAWRLSRQLVSEHGIAVRLWVDNLRSLSRIEPAVDPVQSENVCEGVAVHRWIRGGEDAPDAVADVVIDAFGCGIPGSWEIAMARRAPAPAWIVLEYLSAESWVDSRHGLPSPHPATGLARRFYFPGFTPASGGLLRERELFTRRDAFRADGAAQNAFWSKLGVTRPADEGIVVSLFCYPGAPVSSLLDAWASGDRPVVCLVPEGVATTALDRWADGTALPRGLAIARGELLVARIPFLAQQDYDRLLWVSDLNFVRGEDSFVRAQWAARPFVWNAYPQSANAHAPKLDAFLDRYEADLATRTAAALRSFSMAWNSVAASGPDVGAGWPALVEALPALDERASAWAQALARQTDLASALVKFAADRV
jgi:uncharacterized repeat protein (TIGR03837 family)